jgi:ribosomal protein S18 acetylase RimI-like enzyme
MEIRKASRNDLPACVKIMVEAFAGQENWTEERARARLEEKIREAPHLCFCLELEGKVIGFMFCEQFDYAKGKYLWVAEFAIDPKYQGKGFGKQALEFIERFAKENGFDVLYLAANRKEKAYQLYLKKGFKDTNWFFMEKEL